MQYLADMGAEVIKIEPPNGAFERRWAGADRATVGSVSALFLCANRNVRSLAIDLKRRAPYGIYKAKDCQIALSLTDVGTLAEALKSSMIKAFVGRNAYLERDALAQAVAAEISTQTDGELTPAFDAKGIWYARVDEHNGSFCTVPVNGETATLVSHPIRYDGEVPPFRGFALAPGSDSRAILADAGFSSNEVTELIRDRVVFEPEGVS